MVLQDRVSVLKGIGDKTTQLLHKINIHSIEDLLLYYPRDYETFQEPQSLAEIRVQEISAFRAVPVGSFQTKKVRNLFISTIMVRDSAGSLQLTFFNMPYLHKTMGSGTFYIFRGIVKKGPAGQYVMEQPRIYKEEDYRAKLNLLCPVYSLTKGITNHGLEKAIRQALEQTEFQEEYLPEEIVGHYGFMDWKSALFGVHFPKDREMLLSARRRLVFEEFFLFILSVRRMKESNEMIPNTNRMMVAADTDRLLEALPYRLTDAQKRVWQEIQGDLSGEGVMNRLVQGDVGSGKTIVAFLALLMCVVNGYQGAMMAPTEVLAAQHFESLQSLVRQYHLPFHPVLLTGSLSAKEKREAYGQIESGEANVVFGTHALIQEKAVYRSLALVVTDEQHRFGVRQREALAGKGRDVHVLVMSATPIPRTLAIILYGDLHISVINQQPADRLPIKNCVVNTDYRKTAYAFMQREIDGGRQVYIVCPMVEAGEMEGVENVAEYAQKLRCVFPEEVRIGLLHGRMKPNDKNRIMEDFKERRLDILVSTTVIEVGINVPNATVMLIENAERFGLAQLHQLRGRVGRGAEQSYCIFMSANGGGKTMERLSILNHSNDGFKIAGEDLKLRGPGDLFGIRQSGILDFKIGDIYGDAGILQEASDFADKILREDGKLNQPGHLALGRFLENRLSAQVDFRSI